MKELDYPFNAEQILLKKKKLKRILLQNEEPFLDKRIAILGGSTTNDIRLVLELFLLNQGYVRLFMSRSTTSIIRTRYFQIWIWNPSSRMSFTSIQQTEMSRRIRQ